MKASKAKSKRMVIFSVITASVVVVLLVLNVFLSYFSLTKGMYIDLTPETLYTVSERMKEEISFIDKKLAPVDGDKKIKVTFCTDPDYLVASETTRATYMMALELARIFDNFEVETVNITNNPTALSMYRPTSLAEIHPSDIVVSYGDRYRIVGAPNFWMVDSEDNSGKYVSYNGEYKLATLIKSVTSIAQPKAYFLTDHGETYYDEKNPNSEMSKKAAYIRDLLRDRGLITETLNLSEVPEIPEDCALLIINNPTKDFEVDKEQFNTIEYVSDTEKIDKYLTRNQGAVMVAKDYSITLPVLEDFLHEWGFDFSTSQVRDEEASVPDAEGTNSTIISVYETERDSFANAIYEDFANISSAPATIFSDTGYITNSFGLNGYKNEPGSPDTVKRYASFLKSSETAVAYHKNADGSYIGSTIKENDEGSFDLAAVSVREAFDSVSGEYSHSYLFCSASKDFFSNELLGNPTYANFDITSALVDNISRVDVYASIDLGGHSPSSTSFGGKMLVSTTISTEEEDVFGYDENGNITLLRTNGGLSEEMKMVYSIIAAVIPVALLITGIVVCIRRRFL